MSILKSTKSGRLRIISDYLENKYSKMLFWDGSPKVEYEIIEGKNDYVVRLKPQIQATIIYVNGKEFPCKMVFDNKPYVVFVDEDNHIANVSRYEKHGLLTKDFTKEKIC